jgi:hypothetical protein
LPGVLARILGAHVVEVPTRLLGPDSPAAAPSLSNSKHGCPESCTQGTGSSIPDVLAD